jgi:lipoprotein-anchoring transpeptidase ErfK/SrfK
MRSKIVVAVAACFTLLGSTVHAGQLKFAPSVFQIYGGIQDQQQSVSLFSPRRQSSESSGTAHSLVEFNEPMAPGSILIRTSERKLYFVLEGGRAIMYPIGVGREGFTWSGRNKITRKTTWPDWRPPQVMIDREAKKGHFIPAFMAGGPDNPLGARAMYIGSTEYRIHGTTAPWSIGKAMSSGCIRMMNDEVIDLFNRVKIGADVVVE